MPRPLETDLSQSSTAITDAAPTPVSAGRPRTRIVILGGGFGGVYTAVHLEKLCRGRQDIEVVLISRDNFLLMTPLLFEVCSGTLDFRHCSFPIRAFLSHTRFAEANVEGIDLERRVVHLTAPAETAELAYDHLVLALGGMTNRAMIPGSEHAFTFKTLADALVLRNQLIDRFERADAADDADLKRKLLTFVIIGGGLVGVELLGEMTAMVDGIMPLYKHITRDQVHFIMLQGGIASCRKWTRTWRPTAGDARRTARRRDSHQYQGPVD